MRPWGKGHPSSLWVWIKTIAIMEAGMLIPHIFENWSATWHGDPILGNLHKWNEICICIPMFITAQFTIIKVINEARHSATDGWIKKL